MDEIFHYDDNKTRTICGMKVAKDRSPGHASRSCASPVTNKCQDSGVSDMSTLTPTTKWTVETKLARSLERRKRLEGRFQRERSKRRSTEQDRDEVLGFVKGLMMELEVEDKSSSDRSSAMSSLTGRSGGLSSIRNFLSQHGDEELQERGKRSSSSSDDSDDEYEACVQSYGQPIMSKHEEEEGSESQESVSKLRTDLQNGNVNEEQHDDNSVNAATDYNSDADSNYSSDSSYESEAEDEFPELPVKFRSVEELEVEDDDDCSVDEDSTLNSTSSSLSEKEMQEQNLLQAHAIKKQGVELENLHRLFEESTHDHYDEIDSLERRFRDESLRREDLLERALRYAEQIELSDKQKATDLSDKQAALEKSFSEHSGKVETMQKKTRAELQKQEKLSEEKLARCAQELNHVKESHKEELANQFDQVMEKCTTQHSQAIQALHDRHEAALLDQRNVVSHDNALLHIEEMKELKQRHERDLQDLQKILENELLLHTKRVRQQQKDKNGEQMERLRLENNRLRQELQDRDSTIEQLKTEGMQKGMQKDEELQKLKNVLIACQSRIEDHEEEQERKGDELRKIKKSLNSSNHRIQTLESQDELRQQTTEDIVEAREAATASTTRMIRELREELRERDACIAELESDLDRAMQQAEQGADSNNTETVKKLFKTLCERESEMEKLHTKHSEALTAVEKRHSEEEKRYAARISSMQKSLQASDRLVNEENSKDASDMRKLKKEIEEIEIRHIQELQTALGENDFILENIRTEHAGEIRQVQNVLDKTKKNHAEDIAVLVSKISVLHSLVHYPSDEDKSSVLMEDENTELTAPLSDSSYAHKSSVPMEDQSMNSASTYSGSINSNSRSSGNGKEYDVRYQSQMLNDAVKLRKKQIKGSKWFSSMAQSTIDNASPSKYSSISKDSMAQTESTAYLSSTEFGEDDRSVTTAGSKNSLQRATSQGIIVNPSGPSDGQPDSVSPVVTKQISLEKKAQKSLWSRMRI